MPANHRRGETEAVFDGRPHRLVLTLGALAELEHVFGLPDLNALAERFESGRLKSSDAIAILGAGLRGGGADLSDTDAAALTHADGVAGYVRAVAELLRATFGEADGEGGRQADAPFLGTK